MRTVLYPPRLPLALHARLLLPPRRRSRRPGGPARLARRIPALGPLAIGRRGAQDPGGGVLLHGDRARGQIHGAPGPGNIRPCDARGNWTAAPLGRWPSGLPGPPRAAPRPARPRAPPVEQLRRAG